MPTLPAPLRRRTPTGRTQLVLLAPPWPPMDTPALGVATLAADASARVPHRPVEQSYAYLRWLALLRDRIGEEWSEIYRTVAETGAYAGVGDLLFADALDAASSTFRPEDSSSRAAARLAARWTELLLVAEEHVQAEAQRLVERVGERAVLAVSSTFTQTFAGLAIARRFAGERPDVPVLLGGANLGPEKAAVYLREFPFLTGVAFGEGEATLDAVLTTLDHGAPLVARPGLAVADGDRDLRALPYPDRTDMDTLAPPAVRPYFEQFEEAGLGDEFVPKLSWELARGCWWGERRHCTFCGLNGNGMAFRRRTGDTTAAEIASQMDEFQTLDLMIVDNILDPVDIENVFERMPADTDLQIQIEVKADLTLDQLRRLRDSGVWRVQPGIESLARGPLRLMRKGVTPWMNVRFLRDAEALGLTVAWNILLGFPGEADDDYVEMVGNMPMLFHLQPPALSTRLVLVRYSPLFQDEDIRVAGQVPAPFNSQLWPTLAPEELVDVSDVFVPPSANGISERGAAEVAELVARWRDAYVATELVELEGVDGTEVVRTAGGRTESVLTIDRDTWPHRLWEALRHGASRRRQAELATELGVPPGRVAEAIAGFVDAGVVMRDEGVVLTLPVAFVDHEPVKLSC